MNGLRRARYFDIHTSSVYFSLYSGRQLELVGCFDGSITSFPDNQLSVCHFFFDVDFLCDSPFSLFSAIGGIVLFILDIVLIIRFLR